MPSTCKMSAMHAVGTPTGKTAVEHIQAAAWPSEVYSLLDQLSYLQVRPLTHCSKIQQQQCTVVGPVMSLIQDSDRRSLSHVGLVP